MSAAGEVAWQPAVDIGRSSNSLGWRLRGAGRSKLISLLYQDLPARSLNSPLLGPSVNDRTGRAGRPTLLSYTSKTVLPAVKTGQPGVAALSCGSRDREVHRST